VLQLLEKLIDRCELSMRCDADGSWRVAAKGPLALAALVLLVWFYVRGFWAYTNLRSL
jgi:hypothetical protein